MENVKTQESSKSQEEPQKIMEAFDRLQKVSVILKEMGFRVIDRLITLDALKSPTSEAGFPIVKRWQGRHTRVIYQEKGTCDFVYKWV